MKKRIYYVKDYSIEEIVEKHKEIHNRRPIILNDEQVGVIEGLFPVIYDNKISKRRERTVSESVLYNKYTYLLHSIISKCLGTKDYSIHINASNLKQILGAVYVDMLKTLEELRIIELSDYYKRGEYSRKLWLSIYFDYGYNEIFVNNIRSYIDKEEKVLKQYFEKKNEEHKSQIGTFLFKNYTESLKLLSLSHPKEAIHYADNRIYQSALAQRYYERIIEKYQQHNFSITSIDHNNRIYNILTSTPRELKNFLNIKYSIDIRNSHPLLFNYYIMDDYGIKSSILHQLNAINKDALPIRSVGKCLHKQLKDSGINKENLKHIPLDILEYIYKTSKGVFWDDFKEQFKYLSRQDVKITLFREVFYTKSLTKRGKRFGQLFKKHYPSVNKTISEFIRKDKSKTKLPNTLMSFESKLFQTILEKLYKKKFKVLSIHDAIVVLDIPQNEDCTPELVTSVIKEVYEKYSLYPSISKDEYLSTFGCNIVEETENNGLLIKEFVDKLNQRSDDPLDAEREMIEEMLLSVQQGDAEFVVENGNVVFHPLEMKNFWKIFETLK